MGQIRHGCATTTHAIRAAIQRSQASNAELSRELGINVKTVAKWLKRQTVEDLRTGPKEPRSTVLSAEEEALCIAFRKHRDYPKFRAWAMTVRLKEAYHGTAQEGDYPG